MDDTESPDIATTITTTVLSYDDLYIHNSTACDYFGTDYLEGKIYLVGLFATVIAFLSVVFNTFNCVVYIHSPSLRQSAVFYFGVLSLLDIIMGFNYIAIMSMPVFFDYYQSLHLYHLFLWYFRAVLWESNCTIFASVLLILLATTERLLRTFSGSTIVKLRRFVERNRISLCIYCILGAVAYKSSTYFEITFVEHDHCPENDFSRFEITATELVSENPNYRFWWMFVTRFIVDRTLPFFLLVFMNFAIIKALKKQTFSDVKRNFSASASTKGGRRNLRDATRTLIVMVSMYIGSQAPQIVLLIWETIAKETLVQEENHQMYSYMNDIMSICTLLSSCLRFPVYCACNRQISSATIATIKDFKHAFCKQRKTMDYKPIKLTQPITGLLPQPPTETTGKTEPLTHNYQNSDPIVETTSTSELAFEPEYRLNQYYL